MLDGHNNVEEVEMVVDVPGLGSSTMSLEVDDYVCQGHHCSAILRCRPLKII